MKKQAPLLCYCTRGISIGNIATSSLSAGKEKKSMNQSNISFQRVLINSNQSNVCFVHSTTFLALKSNIFPCE